ncbi:hypothetical protein [Actinomadura sp. WMMA1423]|uniref:hypothetical protein n=1 Tax=Actinomadura sp. WMMA1423 TaxID=2591108 RepID=UPI00114671DB|nr:hypothetical protein [Actinomadura sp. WMMA1423]
MRSRVPAASVSAPPVGRPPTRRGSFGLAATLLAVPTVVMLLDPGLAVVLYAAECAVMLLMLLTAVFAPDPVCERAFRLLRWMTGQPEPAPPAAPSAAPPNPADASVPSPRPAPPHEPRS